MFQHKKIRRHIYLVVGVLVIVDPKDVGVSLPAAVDRVDNVAQTDRLLKKRI